MNWLFCVVLAGVILAGIIGYVRGFTKMVISAVAFLAAVVVTWFVLPPVQKLVIEHTELEQTIAASLNDSVFSQIETDEDVDRSIRSLPLPEAVRRSIEEKLEARDEGVSKKESLSLMVSNAMIGAAVAVVLFVVVRLLLALLIKLLDLMNKLPGLKQMNSILGALVALFVAWIVLSLFFLVVMVFHQTNFGTAVITQVRASEVLSWLYDNNLLVFLFHLAKDNLLNLRSLKM